MEELTITIKNLIEETILSYFNKKVVVSYVQDVGREADRLCKELNCKIFIESTHNTGMFIPWCERDCAYILIEYPQNNYLYIRTAYHEYQHCIDYSYFLAFFENEEAMASSQEYQTFNIFSEFNATFSGYKNYFYLVQHPEGFMNDALKTAAQQFLQQDKIINKFQYLNHALEYYAKCKAIDDFCNSDKAQKEFYANKNSLERIEKVIKCIDGFEYSYDWYKKFDQVCREYIGK